MSLPSRFLVIGLLILGGCASPATSGGDRVVRIHPLQEPIDRQAGGAVEIVSAEWTSGADIRSIVRDEVTEALRRACVFVSEGAGGEVARYLVRIEMHRRELSGSQSGDVEGAVSVLDRQRNLVTATFRLRIPTSGDDPRRAARDLGQTVADVLSEPVTRD